MSTNHTRGLRLRATPDMDTRDCAVVNAGIVALEAQRDELLAALQELADKSRIAPGYTSSSALTLKLASIGSLARDAIAKATGEQS